MSMGKSIALSGAICLGVAAFCAVCPSLWLANDWTYRAAFAALAASSIPTLVCMWRGEGEGQGEGKGAARILLPGIF